MSNYTWQKPGELGRQRTADVLTEEQDAQLAELLAQLMAFGWGRLEIEIREGKVRFFRPMPSIPAGEDGKR